MPGFIWSSIIGVLAKLHHILKKCSQSHISRMLFQELYTMSWPETLFAQGQREGSCLVLLSSHHRQHPLFIFYKHCHLAVPAAQHAAVIDVGWPWDTDEKNSKRHTTLVKKVLAHKVTVSMNKLSVSEESLSFRDVVISVHSVNPASSRIRPGFTLTSSSFMWHIKSQGWQIKRPRVLITPFKPSFNI